MKIVQIGANKGNTDNDPVWALSQKHLPESQDWQFIFVEPNIKALKILKDNYISAGFHNIKLLQVAVSNKSDIISLYIDHDVPGSEGSQHASIYKDHMYKMHHKDMDITSVDVSCVTLSDVLNMADGEIDYLQIDTEGHDGVILLGCNLNHFYVKTIEYEYIHLDQHTIHLVNNHLLSCGYILQNKTKDDYIFRKK